MDEISGGAMPRVTITLPSDLLSELIEITQARTKTEAMMTAIKDEIRRKKLENIKSMAGKMEFIKSTEELRHGDERLR